MKLRAFLAIALTATTITVSHSHHRLRIGAPIAHADDGGDDDGGDDGNGDGNGDGNDDDSDDADDDTAATQAGYGGYAALDPDTLGALIDQSAAQGFGNIGAPAGALGAATAYGAMNAGIDALGGPNMGMAASVAAQAALDAGGTMQAAAQAAAAAAGITAQQEAYGLDQGQMGTIGAAIADEAANWGSA